jgi:hypothetical protein
MKKSFLIISLLIFALSLQAQKDTVNIFSQSFNKAFVRETTISNINIYPVPVRENTFSIRTDRDMSLVKVTNMIGQDIFRAQYKNPLSFTKINLENPARGIYLVTIGFADGTRVVKKIMIENPE